MGRVTRVLPGKRGASQDRVTRSFLGRSRSLFGQSYPLFPRDAWVTLPSVLPCPVYSWLPCPVYPAGYPALCTPAGPGAGPGYTSWSRIGPGTPAGYPAQYTTLLYTALYYPARVLLLLLGGYWVPDGSWCVHGQGVPGAVLVPCPP